MNLPKVLPYHPISNYDKVPELEGKFCYIVEDYDDKGGVSVVVTLQNKKIYYQFGTFAGGEINPQDKKHPLHETVNHIAASYCNKLATTMHLLKLEQAQFFWAKCNKEDLLVDLQISFNKLAGPGMLRDIFGKNFPCQRVKEIAHVNKDQLPNGPVIIKPSAFKMMVRDSDVVPMYARILKG
jgi:hypothetical protein